MRFIISETSVALLREINAIENGDRGRCSAIDGGDHDEETYVRMYVCCYVVFTAREVQDPRSFDRMPQ